MNIRYFFFFKQRTAYEVRISDWSSDVCSSDLLAHMAIFRSRKVTLAVAEMLSWLCGGAYAPIGRIVRMHMRHHVDRADLALFDPRVFLKTTPGWLDRKSVV